MKYLIALFLYTLMLIYVFEYDYMWGVISVIIGFMYIVNLEFD